MTMTLPPEGVELAYWEPEVQHSAFSWILQTHVRYVGPTPSGNGKHYVMIIAATYQETDRLVEVEAKFVRKLVTLEGWRQNYANELVEREQKEIMRILAA